MKKIFSAVGILFLILSSNQALYAGAPSFQEEYLFYNLSAFALFSISGIIAETIIAYIFFIKNEIGINNIKFVIIANIITYPLYYFFDYIAKDYFMIILHDKLIYVLYYILGEILIIFFEAYFLYFFCKKQSAYQNFLFLSILMNSVSLIIGAVAAVLGMYFLKT